MPTPASLNARKSMLKEEQPRTSETIDLHGNNNPGIMTALPESRSVSRPIEIFKVTTIVYDVNVRGNPLPCSWRNVDDFYRISVRILFESGRDAVRTASLQIATLLEEDSSYE